MKPGGAKEGRLFGLDCSAQPPLLSRYDKGSGSVLETGPVDLAGKGCRSVASSGDAVLRRLPRDGVWKRFYKDSTAVLSSGLYKRNNEEGQFEYFSKDGGLVRTVLFQNGQKEGEEIAYFDGSRDWKYKGNNHADQKTGLWQSRFSVDDSCITEGNYRNGKKEGAWTVCSQNDKKRGYLSFKGNYRADLRDGAALLFHENGGKQGEGVYRADLKCAENPPPEGIEACGKKIGRWTFYSKEGNKVAEGSYDAVTGRRSGVWSEYYASGKIMAKGPRRHTRYGVWTFYAQNGSILGKFLFDGSENFIRGGEIWKDGKLSAKALPGVGCRMGKNRIGKEVMQCEKEAGSFGAAFVKYNASADRLEFTLKMQNGLWADYDPSGKKIGEGEYLNGRKNGSWKELQSGKWVVRNYMMGRIQ